jgi:hypothetical protein
LGREQQMKQVLLIVVLIAVAVDGFYRHRSKAAPPESNELRSSIEAPANASFTCDGRVYCSQMHSCAEATFFIKNCPGTKMDGNNDGVPCEKQWCR